MPPLLNKDFIFTLFILLICNCIICYSFQYIVIFIAPITESNICELMILDLMYDQNKL